MSGLSNVKFWLAEHGFDRVEIRRKNFIPRIGMVAGIIPGLIGNVFEFALMKRNAQGKN